MRIAIPSRPLVGTLFTMKAWRVEPLAIIPTVQKLGPVEKLILLYAIYDKVREFTLTDVRAFWARRGVAVDRRRVWDAAEGS